jgi:myo-inositol-1(or 4)-monophosphatase
VTIDPAYLAVAADAALAAGALQRRYFRSALTITKKGRIDLVTEADVAVEREIQSRIHARFPDHAFLGEESGASTGAAGASHRWIVDPIDGTTNFAHGLALFCVSIGLEIEGRMAVAAVYDPMAEELFTAERGSGARLNGRRIQVTAEATLVNSLLVTGFPYAPGDRRAEQLDVFASMLAEAQAVRRLGSAALDLCLVAAGRFDGFWEQGLQPWDVAAGGLIVEEAGGRVTGYDGAPFDPFARQIVASNGVLHPSLLDLIARARH